MLHVDEFYIGHNCFARVENDIVRIRKQGYPEIMFDVGGVSILYHTIESRKKENND
jgi:hypothetical protein